MRTTSFVIRSDNELPRHLAQRQPFILANTEMILRYALQDVVANDGRVIMAGAIEFQTQINAELLADVCDPKELYRPELGDTLRFRCVYDPEIQRGVKETKEGLKEYLREKEIEAMMADIAANRFECPQLMWNLRAGETVWVYVQGPKQLRIYQGVATRPDTNHRHHAIIRFHHRYLRWMAETESEKMADYNPQRAYGLIIYTDDFQGEAHRFCVYNFLGWRMASTTAHYIESKTQAPHIHSKLARELMERSDVLGTANVEILCNQLSKHTAKMVTFGTLVDAVRMSFPDLTEESYAEVLEYLVEFIGELSQVRPNEIALLGVAERQKVRETSVADQAIMWRAYIQLAAWLREQKEENWKACLQILARPYTHRNNGQSETFDLFSRDNPIWLQRGVLAPGKSEVSHVVNKRSSSQAAFQLLRFLAVCYQGEQGSQPPTWSNPS
ncbi:MAG: DNA sulfur modification protein DndB [Candidatus Binatia bacterium]